MGLRKASPIVHLSRSMVAVQGYRVEGICVNSALYGYRFMVFARDMSCGSDSEVVVTKNKMTTLCHVPMTMI